MLHQILCSKKLLWSIFNLVLFTKFVCTKTISQHSNNDKIQSDNASDISKDASEIIEKILNVPVTLNFEDEPVTEKGNYGGYRRNFQLTPEEEKVDDGQFGARIILGIVENIPETTTLKSEDQKKSQTIVKYFDKEDYGGIKNNPIIVDDANENFDNEKTRNRKEIINLKQVESPIIPDEDIEESNERQNENVEEEEQIQPTENYDENEEIIEEEPSLENTHTKHKHEEIKEIPKYIYKEGTKHRYEEYDIPPNHKETYTEIEEEPNDKPAKLQESNNGNQDYTEQPQIESFDKNDEKSESKVGDQKGSADETHEEVKKKKKKGGKHSAGKGDEHHSDHHEEKGEKGEKAYKGYHEETKSNKGHHDKEDHGNKYTDKGGSKKKHHEEHEHHGEHHKGEKGEKESDFSEEGKHSKGHSTKGEHNIHKKDEYEKKQEFYDEHHEGGEHEKHGGFHFDDHFEKGGHKKGGHHKKGEHEDHYGKKSHHEKGHHYDDKKGHKKAAGHDEHHKHHSKYGKKGGDSGKKQWSYKKGNGGGGGKKKHYKAQVAHSVPQLKKIHPSIQNNYKERIYPHYYTRIHIRNDNRRNDVDVTNSTEEKIETNDDSKENKTLKLEENSGEIEEDSKENEESESIQSLKHSHIDQTNKSETLPKIYLIIPDNFEEQLQKSEEAKEENISDFSFGDSEEESEEFSDNKVLSTHKKTTKIIEPLKAKTFPEEHKRRLSEVEYVIHKIGTKYGNVKNNEKRDTINRTPRKFSVNVS